MEFERKVFAVLVVYVGARQENHIFFSFFIRKFSCFFFLKSRAPIDSMGGIDLIGVLIQWGTLDSMGTHRFLGMKTPLFFLKNAEILKKLQIWIEYYRLRVSKHNLGPISTLYDVENSISKKFG